MSELGGFEEPRRLPWRRETGIPAALGRWERRGRLRHVVLDRTLPPREAEYAEAEGEGAGVAVSPAVRAALAEAGVCRLYAHQAQALRLARERRDFVVATPTSSGKSLCYNLPVMEALAEGASARALYLFPTKALARDQEEALRGLLQSAGLAHGAITYDGDTPGDARRAARQRSGVLLTNPDMLHAGILPHHASWARLFANLRYVVVDELHTYRGVFGSHLANVLRRLVRIARFHGSDPVFIAASATIGNPAEHAARILGRPVEVVAQSGAPAGPRRVLVYNPPVVNAELGIRASYLKTAVSLTFDLVRADVPTLVFGQSRSGVEVMLKYLRDRAVRAKIDPSSIEAYRGGYLPETRRRIERGLRSGAVRCVVATSALELGVDIGSLDAVVCAGYPGSIADTWQRFGRAGRRRALSLAVLVTSSAPLDQYLAHEPGYLVGAPIEEARIDADNVEILVQHARCAAFELPFEAGEPFGTVDADDVEAVLELLTEHRLVHPVAGPSGRTVYHWVSDSYPANDVSLRNIDSDNFVIVEQIAADRRSEGKPAERVLAEMDFRSTHTMLHEQAIYQHEGAQYQVERLDFDHHKAFVRKVEPDYYTTAMTHTKVSVLEVDRHAGLCGPGGEATACAGDVSVVEKVVGYKKIKFHTHENVGYGEVQLPELQMQTSACWVTFPEPLIATRPESRPEVIDALRGLSVAMHTAATISLMVDPRDLGRTLGDRREGEIAPGKGHGPGFDPTIFLYDRFAGGIGLAPRLFECHVELLRRARGRIERCDCREGCPACVGPSLGVDAGPGEPTRAGAPLASRKALALGLLDAIGIDGAAAVAGASEPLARDARPAGTRESADAQARHLDDALP
ncbi:MAG: DEAD/DEAH box helicase [Myxococcales bacterium]|nr:DEAD/DEAH box helicase [Myxococcales bacterium]